MSAGDRKDGVLCVVPWAINPFRGDKFEEIWTPAAEAVLDYGATGWALFRSQEGQLDFTQLAFFSDKADWDRYWYSDEIGEAKVSRPEHVPSPPPADLPHRGGHRLHGPRRGGGGAGAVAA